MFWKPSINSTLNLLTMMVLIFKMFRVFNQLANDEFSQKLLTVMIRISFLNLRIHKKMTVMRFVTFSAE